MLDFIFSGAASNYTNSLTLVLAAEQPGINAAPAAVWFECTAVSGADATSPKAGAVRDPRYRDILYLWDFGDAANAIPTTNLNMPDAWKNVNMASGRRVAHCFNDHGTYAVTCYAYEPDTRRFGWNTIEVMIGDPDGIFPGNKTIIYDPANGNHSAAHAGATVVTTLTAMISARSALGSTAASRLLLAPGLEIVMGSSVNSISSAGGANLRIGALDPNGIKPKFRADRRTTNQYFFRDSTEGCKEVVLYGLELQGEWPGGGWGRDRSLDLAALDGKKRSNGHGNSLSFAHRCTWTGSKPSGNNQREQRTAGLRDVLRYHRDQLAGLRPHQRSQ